MNNRTSISKNKPLKSILITNKLKKQNTKHVTWNISHEEKKQIDMKLIKNYRLHIMQAFLIKFKGCIILPNKQYMYFLDELDKYFLKPLYQIGALKNNKLNIEAVTEIAFDYIYLHKKNNYLFDNNFWTLHFNGNKAADDLLNNKEVILSKSNSSVFKLIQK